MSVACKDRFFLNGNRFGRRRCAGHDRNLLARAVFDIAVDGRHKIRISARETVFADIESGELVGGVGAEKIAFFKDHEKCGHRDSRPGRNGDKAEELETELREVSRVEEAVKAGRSIRVG